VKEYRRGDCKGHVATCVPFEGCQNR